MNFKKIIFSILRILLFPISFIYGCIIYLRNYMFDKGILKSKSFNIPIICIGNISVGGTGKSPMIEYLISLLSTQIKTATLSRGYKRKSKGFLIANTASRVADLGDEPSQFFQKHPGITVAVGEKRVEAIEQIVKQKPDTAVILLDDAFQHRAIKAGLNILLTDFRHLYTNDYFLPTGSLRDQRSSSKRAQIIVVTKCPGNLSLENKINIENRLKLNNAQSLFFTTIRYGMPYHLFNKNGLSLHTELKILLIHGIAQPKTLQDYIAIFDKNYTEINFPDHHQYTTKDIQSIIQKFEFIASKNKIIITTEKDAARLMPFKKQLSHLSIYALPIQSSFLFNQAAQFNALIENFIIHFNEKK